MGESQGVEQPTAGSGWKDAFTSSNSGKFTISSSIISDIAVIGPSNSVFPIKLYSIEFSCAESSVPNNSFVAPHHDCRLWCCLWKSPRRGNLCRRLLVDALSGAFIPGSFDFITSLCCCDEIVLFLICKCCRKCCSYLIYLITWCCLYNNVSTDLFASAFVCLRASHYSTFILKLQLRALNLTDDSHCSNRDKVDTTYPGCLHTLYLVSTTFPARSFHLWVALHIQV